jgi:hypothetical protein
MLQPLQCSARVCVVPQVVQNSNTVTILLLSAWQADHAQWYTLQVQRELLAKLAGSARQECSSSWW